MLVLRTHVDRSPGAVIPLCQKSSEQRPVYLCSLRPAISRSCIQKVPTLCRRRARRYAQPHLEPMDSASPRASNEANEAKATRMGHQH